MHTRALQQPRPLEVALLFSVFVVAACGLLYELAAGAIASYVLGDSVLQFSTVIGAYLFAMGMGSWLSRFFDRQLPAHFLRIELMVALVGGALPALLFLANAYTPGAFRFLLYTLVLMVGTLVGLEIPLVMRILRRNVALKELVSQVLTYDYLGALAVSLAFPLVLVPQLGLIRTGLLFGVLNASVALWALWLFRYELRQWRAHAVACGLTLAALLGGFALADHITSLTDDQFYQDHIVSSLTTPYQRMVVTAGKFKATFEQDCVIAVTGADMSPTLDGEPIENWRSYRVAPGQTLALGMIQGAGVRAYVAVSGGFDVPEYLGSRATYAPGAIGGFEGRALKKGDQVPSGKPEGALSELAGRRVKASIVPTDSGEWEVEAVPGPQTAPDYWTWEDYDHFFSHPWKLDRNSNRMGYRLEPHSWQWARKTGGVAGGHPSNILDNGYAVGAVNISGDQPIILCVDGPTLGGFVCAAGGAYGAMRKLGQRARWRDPIRFKELTIDEPVDLARATDALVSDASLERV